MPAKRQAGKKESAAKSKEKKDKSGKKPKKPIDEIEDPPLIIKGGSQGSTTDLPTGSISEWELRSRYPLDYTFGQAVTDQKPNLYTLSLGERLSGFQVRNEQGAIIFKFPNETDYGDFEIEFLP